MNNSMKNQKGLKIKEFIDSIFAKVKSSKKVAIIVGCACLVVLLFVILILTLNGGKELTCVKLDTSDYMLYREELKFTFNEDKVKELKMKYDIEIADGSDYDSLEFSNDLEEECDDFLKDSDIEGISCKVSRDDEFISFTLTAKDESFKYVLGYDYDDKITYDNLKEELFDDDYFCK